MMETFELSDPLEALRFCLSWIMATIIGVVLGAVVSISMGITVTPVVLFPLIGVFIGFFQRLVLKQFVPKSGRWILASILGWTISFGMMSIAGDLLHNIVMPIDLGLIFLLGAGAIIGILQWLVIRRTFSGSGWWIFASAISLGFVGLVSGGIIVGFWDLLASTVIRGSIMGFTLFLILYHTMEKRIIHRYIWTRARGDLKSRGPTPGR